MDSEPNHSAPLIANLPLDFQNPQKNTAHKLWFHFLIANWFTYFWGFFFVIVTNFTEVMIPKAMQWVIDLLQNNPKLTFLLHRPKIESFYLLVGFFFCILVVQGLARAGWRLTLGRQTHRISAPLKSLLWKRTRFFPKEQLDAQFTPGYLMNAATSDVNIARFLFGFTLIGTIDAIFLTCFTITAMMLIDVPLTLATLVVIPAMPFLIDKLARQERKLHHLAQEALAVFNTLTAQAVATVRLQRLTQTGKFWTNRLTDSATKYKTQRLAAIKVSLAFIPAWGSISVISYIILFTLGLKKLFSGQLSIGEFIALQSYVFILQGPIGEVGYIISEWQRALTSLRRLIYIYTQPLAPELTQQGSQQFGPGDAYKITNLSFNYDKKDVIYYPDFSLKKGGRLGITGPIGSGKSTLVQILAGLDHKFAGDLLFFSQDIRRYQHQFLRKTITLVPQKPFLFADSIKNNVAMDQTYSEDEIWHFLEIAGLADDVKQFPEGLQTQLGEWGINLSGGQKQRLTIARAIIRKPQVLLLDDCLSAVDTVTEQKILHAMDHVLDQTTIIWTAHRTSTLKNCDQILELGK